MPARPTPRHADGRLDIDAWSQDRLRFMRLSRKERQRELEREHRFTSSWYVFYHSVSDRSQGRDGQVLAVWSCRAPDFPLMTYRELKEIDLKNKWFLIPGFDRCTDHRDCLHVADCVRDWLEEVEEEFPQGASDLRTAGRQPPACEGTDKTTWPTQDQNREATNQLTVS